MPRARGLGRQKGLWYLEKPIRVVPERIGHSTAIFGTEIYATGQSTRQPRFAFSEGRSESEL